MATSFNRVILAGNLTRDPELRFLSNEQAVVKFSLAVNRRYKDRSGEMQEEATFVDCEAWSRTAELVGQYLTKGSSCLVEGRLKLDRWEDRDGNNRSQLRVVAENVQFLDSRGGGQSSDRVERRDEPARQSGPPALADDDPPF